MMLLESFWVLEPGTHNLSMSLQFSAVQLEYPTVAHQDALYGAPVEINEELSEESGFFEFPQRQSWSQ